MRKCWTRGLTLAALLLAAPALADDGTKDGPEALGRVIAEKLKLTRELTELLDGIKDKAAAEKAKPKIEELTKRLAELNDGEKKLKKKVEAGAREAADKLAAAADKVADNKEAEAVLAGTALEKLTGGTIERFAKQEIRLNTELASILEGIKDKESAEKAVPKVKELAKRSEDLRQRAKDLPLAREEDLKVLMKYMGDMMNAQVRIVNAIAVLSSRPEGKTILEALPPGVKNLGIDFLPGGVPKIEIPGFPKIEIPPDEKKPAKP